MDRKTNSTVSLALILAFLCFIGNSPKWSLPICAWLGVAFFLYFIRSSGWWRGILLGWAILTAGTSIANLGVVPLPLPAMLLFMTLSSLLGLLPFLLDKWLAGRYPSFLSILIFPASFTLLDYWVAAHSPAGTWGIIAYSQAQVAPLFQLGALGGIWVLGFLIYWFGSTANYILERRRHERSFRTGALIYTTLLAAAFLYGTVRLQVAENSDAPKLRVAAVTVKNTSLMEQLYFAVTGERITIPTEINQTDPLVQKANEALAQFVADPQASRFDIVYDEGHRLLDELLALSRQAVGEGARLIAWSEGVLITGKAREAEYIDRVRAFARKHDSYLFFPMASIFKADATAGAPFMENKILTIDPQGQVVQTYFKNRPVPGEPSLPGDGRLPVLDTPLGRLGQVICYDADFPALMDQLHEQRAQLFVAPSGDWRAISPYHSYMAAARSVENGAALLRPVTGGLSLATDPYGRILATDDYFADDRHYLVADIPMAEVRTLYARWGNWTVWVSGMLLIVGGVSSWRQKSEV